MSNLKKMLSVFMAVAMLMSVMVMGTGATFTDQKDVTNTEAVDMNVALGIIKGYEDGSFKPTANVTRAEMAKMICFMLNAGKDPTLGTVTANTFTDTKGHWAAPYIEYCAASGIVAGVGGNLFAPDATVTGTQAAKMLLVCMGYEAATEGYNGATWAVKINVRANAKGLYDDVSVDPNAPLNRDNASQMVWNALNAGMNEYSIALGTDANGALQNIKTPKDKTRTVTYANNNTKTVSMTMLWEKFKAESAVGVIEGYKWDKTEKEFRYTICYGLNANKTEHSGTDHDTQVFTSKKDYTGLFGLNTKVVYKTDSNDKEVVYGMFAKKSKILAKATLNDLASNATDTIKFDGTKYKVNYTQGNTPTLTLDNLPLYKENEMIGLAANTKTTFGVVDNTASNLAYEVKLIDKDNDGKVDFGIYLPFTYGKVSSTSSRSISINSGSEVSSPKFDTDTIYDGVKKDDAVKVILEANSAYEGKTITKMESFEGSVTGTKGIAPNNELQIDGKWYTNGNTSSNGTPVTGNVGNKSTFYKVGSFVYFADQLQTGTLENLLYVAGTNGLGLSKEAKVYFTDGTSATVSIKEVCDGVGTADSTSTFNSSMTSQAYAGQMYTFSKKGNEYTLNRLDVNNNLNYGKTPISATANNSITKATTDVSGKLKVNNRSFSFADDAVVFIEKTDLTNDVKVVTGKVARDYSTAISGESNKNATVVYNNVNGTDTVRAACIISSSDGIPSSKGESGNYAYVLAGSYTTKVDGTNYKATTIWNGTKNIDVRYSTSSSPDLKKGDVIKYSDLGNGEIEVKTADVMKTKLNETVTDGTAGSGVVAVKGIADGGKTLGLVSNRAASDASAVDYYITKDTKYLYVDSDNKKGEEAGSVNLASLNGSVYEANAMIYVDATDNQIDLIVIDTSNFWVQP